MVVGLGWGSNNWAISGERTATGRPIVAPYQDDEGPFIGHDFIDGYRVARITEKLAERDDWTVGGAGSGPITHPVEGDACSERRMRMVVDVGEWDDNRFVLPGGQSGNPMSPHYDDQFDLYRFGGAISIAWSAEAMDSTITSELMLESSEVRFRQR